MTEPFTPPPYPYERLSKLIPIAEAHDGGMVDLSIGTPCDRAPKLVVDALATSGAEHGYPPSVGLPVFLEAASRWMSRRLGAEVSPSAIAACVGTKEFVASLPVWLKLRYPDKDTVLYPSISYPSYEMGAILARCRAVPVATKSDGSIDVTSIAQSDIDRALCLWINSPANPHGALDDMAEVAEWVATTQVPTFSDECYVEFTWQGGRETLLRHRTENVVAVHSLSKRSNLAGLRAGFYAGDEDLVHYLSEVRKHVGLMMPGPVQHAAAVALDDDQHVEDQRALYLGRLHRLADALQQAYGIPVELPQGGFYIWAQSPAGDGWAFAERLASDAGLLASPGEFYGEAGHNYVRLAVVQPDKKMALVENRLALLG